MSNSNRAKIRRSKRGKLSKQSRSKLCSRNSGNGYQDAGLNNSDNGAAGQTVDNIGNSNEQ